MTGPVDAYRLAASAYSRALTGRGGAGDEMLATEANVTPSGSGVGASFADMVQHSLDKTIRQQQSAEAQATEAVSGRGDLTSVVTSVAEAEVALQAVVAVRDRVIEAYKDIMRMPI